MNRRTASLALAAALTAGPTLAKERAPMPRRPINPTGTGYAQAHLVTGAQRLLFISGQIPAGEDGQVPPDFKDQARLVWRNIERQLAAAGMTFADLVKFTVFLSDRRWRQANYEVRQEVLGDIAPAMTIIIAGIYDEAWLLEIEAIAAA